MAKLVYHWVEDDWCASTLTISCDKCGANIYNEVVPFKLTYKRKKDLGEQKTKNIHFEYCPYCGEKFDKTLDK